MKTATQFFSLMMIVFIVGVAGETNAQGRGHHHDRDRDERHEKHDRDHHRKPHWKDDRRGHHYGKHHSHEHSRHGHHRSHRHVVHRHDTHHHHAPVLIRRYHERPRYIYYRDYDVYYDFHRDVYITWSGRNWAISASLPVVLHRVDRRRVVRMEVDYVRDDFPAYLQTRRPVYTRVYTEF